MQQQKEQDASGLSGLWRTENISKPAVQVEQHKKQEIKPAFDQEGDDPRCGPVRHLMSSPLKR